MRKPTSHVTGVGVSSPKVVKDIGFTIDELNTTQSELTDAISNLQCDPKLKLRLCRIVANKFGYARNIVNGQRWLERNGYITVDRSENDVRQQK